MEWEDNLSGNENEWVWELEDEVTVLFEMEHSYLLCLYLIG